MEESKKDYTFKDYGNFYSTHSDILKGELEKRNIPVKVSYSSTGLGPKIFGNVSFADHKIMVRGCDFEEVRKIQKKLGIEKIDQDDKKTSNTLSENKIVKIIALLMVLGVAGFYILSFINSLLYWIK